MKRLLSILTVCAVAASAIAVPARREGILRTAADGTQKMVYLHGDAFNHYMTDAEGQWLDEQTLEPLNAEVQAARAEQSARRVQARRVQQPRKIGGALNLAPRGLIILVNFQDKAFVTPFDTIENMINGEHFTRNYSYTYTYKEDGSSLGKKIHVNVHSSGSARQYFHDQSWGQYNPVFDVVGPVTVSKNMADYGGNDSSGNDKNVGALIKEACKLADEAGVDFSIYDNDNDSKVDFVYVIYAGYGEADGGGVNTIWPHNYDLSYYGAQYRITLDGKSVRNYACSNELNYVGGHYAGIGTFCHEFSHVLGLPDLYYTGSGTSPHTLYDWDILDYGPYNNDGNTPPAYSAYERFYMGWLTPRVLKEPESVWLGKLNEDQMALLICQGDQHNLVGNDPNPKTFYLLENRQKTGWDAYLPGKGLLITKIQYNEDNWIYNQVNNYSSSMGVDIIEAKANTTTGAYGTAKATDAYPAGATSWTGFAGHEVTEIELNEHGAITFSYRGAPKTPIDNVDAEEKAQKILLNGQVLIQRNGKTYDVTGRTVEYESHQL